MNVASEMLSNEKKWEIATNLIQDKLINKINYKYGWQSNDELNDTYNDLLIITYELLDDYEKRNNINLNDINSLSKEEKKEFVGKIIGKYRLSVWKKRSELNLRLSDIYNISDDSSDEKLTVYSSDNSYFQLQDTKCVMDFEKKELIKINERRESLCNNLTSILKTDVESLITACMLGDEKGIRTHLELSKKNNKCRSGITRKIGRAIVTLRKFIDNNKITYQQILTPTEYDYKVINDLINKHKNADNSVFKINNILNIKNFKCKNKRSYKRKIKDNTLKIHVHSIEEFFDLEVCVY